MKIRYDYNRDHNKNDFYAFNNTKIAIINVLIYHRYFNLIHKIRKRSIITKIVKFKTKAPIAKSVINDQLCTYNIDIERIILLLKEHHI